MATTVSSSKNDEVKQLTQRIEFARLLLDKAHLFKARNKIQGMQRIEKQIKAEISMLEKLISDAESIREHHLISTNLLHLEGVLHICENICTVTAVEKFFKYNAAGLHHDNTQHVMADVVCNNGSMWIKVFARKRNALHKKWLGDCNFGDKSAVDFAEEYIKASSENLYNFSQPSIVFVFFDGITRSIAKELLAKDVQVVGPVYDDDSVEDAPSPLQIMAMFRHTLSVTAQPVSLPFDHIVNKCSLINMDISSMLAWVSSITHHASISELKYNDRILSEQAQQELKDPLWPRLQKATEGKSLLACQTAIRDFESIVSVVAGPNEKERAKELLARIHIVDDNPSERALSLHCSGRIKERTKIIFGTGDTLKAVTLTANEGFVRAASGRGVHFNVIVHPCRALAELDYRSTKGNVSSSESQDDSSINEDISELT